ncbi:MAG: CDP-alcohol phosphatidyltransferase family protein [archaeon]
MGKLNPANAITIARVAGVYLAVLLIYFGKSYVSGFAAVFLILLNFLLDSADGYVSRKLKVATRAGAFLDILADRIVELTLFVVFSDLGLVPLWVPLVLLARGLVTDSIRGAEFSRGGKVPYKIGYSKLGKFLVSSRLMRELSGISKAAAFTLLALLCTAAKYFPDSDFLARGLLSPLTNLSVLAAVAVNILRGLPVILESGKLFLSSPKS